MKRNQHQFTIWDLDNCLSDDAARLRLINWAAPEPEARYAPYHAHCGTDPVGNLNVFHAVSQLGRPVFFTARPERYRLPTTAWVRCELDIEQPVILMRANGDHRCSVDVKRDMLRQYAAMVTPDRGHPSLCAGAFDDREDIVDMYRDAGVNAALLSIHRACAMTRPTA